MSDLVKGILVAVGIAAALGITALIWSGIESEIAENPAFTELHTEVSDLKTEIKEVRTEVKDLRTELSDTRIQMAGLEGTLIAVKDQGNALLKAFKR